MTDAQKQSLALAFLERFWADRDAEIKKGLADYLAQFPGDEETIANEYLSALSEARDDAESEESENFEAGRVGPYRLLEELGRGGQGVVWLAEDTRLGRKIALKVLTGMGPGAESHIARFKREAELASKLEHPGICGVHDTGIEGGVPYIAMRYIDGETLGDRLSRIRSETTSAEPSSFMSFEGGEETTEVPASASSTSSATSSSSSIDRPELERTIAAFEKIATALHAAHEVGIVHRDIKPGNIMLSKANEPILLDFGLARDDSEDAGPSLTQTGDLFGTPAYMSPEQITGRRVHLDRRSDVYSLGVTLYECLTMKRPFEAPTRESLYQAIMSKEAQPVRKLNRQIPSDLEVVLQCAMDKDRDKRYQTAADLAEDLRRIRKGEPILAKKVSVLGRAWRWSKRRPAAAALLCVLALGTPLISGLGVWYWEHRDEVRDQKRAKIAERVEHQIEIGFHEQNFGNHQPAIQAFEKALTLNESSTEAAVGLALSHLQRKAPAKALEALERSEGSGVDSDIHAWIKALVLLAMGRSSRDAVLSARPKVKGPLIWFIEGSILREHAEILGRETDAGKKMSTRAIDALSRAVQSSPRARRIYHFQLAAATRQLKSPVGDTVADAIESLWPESGLAWTHIGAAAIDLDRRIKAHQESIRIDPDSSRSYPFLGVLLCDERKEYEAAEKAFRKFTEIRPEDAPNHANLGIALRHQKKFGDAILSFRESIRLDETAHREPSATKHTTLGHLLRETGKLQEAVESYQTAIEIDDQDAQAHIQLGLLHYNTFRRYEAAEVSFRKANKLLPRDRMVRTYLGNALLAQGRLDEALGCYEEVLAIDPTFKSAQLGRGMTLRRLKRFEGAITEFQLASRIAPVSARDHFELGLALDGAKRWDEAVAALDAAIAMLPRHAESYCNKGELLEILGRHEASASAYRRGHELGSRRGESWTYPSGEWLERIVTTWTDEIWAEGDPAKARKVLEEYAKSFPKIRGFRAGIAELTSPDGARRRDARRQLQLGYVHRKNGRLDEAKAAYRKAIETDPDYAKAYNDLAWLQVNPEGDSAHRNPEAAVLLATKAVEASKGKKAGHLVTLVEALLATSKISGAAKIQKQLIELLKEKKKPRTKVAEAEAKLKRIQDRLATEKKD